MGSVSVLYDMNGNPHACKGGTAVTDVNSGEMLCSCGVVLEDKTVYTSDYGKNPIYTSLLLDKRQDLPLKKSNEANIGTAISSKDALGKNVPESFKLRKWQLRSVEKKEWKMLKSANFVETLASKMGMSIDSPVVSRANEIMREFFKASKSKVKETRTLAAASVYQACKEQGVPRSLAEISILSNNKRTLIGAYERKILKTLYNSETHYFSDTKSYIEKFANMLNSKSGTKRETMARRALWYMKQPVVEEALEGKKTESKAAALLYKASVDLNSGYTQKDIAEVALITEVTLRNVYKVLKPLVAELPTSMRVSST